MRVRIIRSFNKAVRISIGAGVGATGATGAVDVLDAADEECDLCDLEVDDAAAEFDDEAAE